MNWMEIALLVLGAGAVIASFLIPDKRQEDEEPQRIDEGIIKTLVEKEFAEAKERVVEVVDETLEYAVEKTERASERISNEKIMAISDYSETVLADINKAHQEVLFLYDMLNDKHSNIKETVKQVDKTTKEAEAAMSAVVEAAKLQSTQAMWDGSQEDTGETSPSYIKAEQEKAAKEKEYARRQMARLIIPMQQESPVSQNIGNTEKDELKPLIVKNVQILSDGQTAVAGGKHVEPYSFVQQAPKLDKNGNEDTVKEAAATENKDNNNDRILSLHRSGMSSVDIARELGLGVGEVKLVINLFKGI